VQWQLDSLSAERAEPAAACTRQQRYKGCAIVALMCRKTMRRLAQLGGAYGLSIMTLAIF